MTLKPVRYFENWKMFEPKKLSPVSIDDCNPEIAVMTLIEIPDVVSADRSLLAPSDRRAILIISQIIGDYDLILRRVDMAGKAGTSVRDAIHIGALQRG
jgi:hypothetical protein